MSTLPTVPEAPLQRRSAPPRLRLPWTGWTVGCPSCGAEVVSGQEGRCPRCRDRCVGATLSLPPDPLPPQWTTGDLLRLFLSIFFFLPLGLALTAGAFGSLTEGSVVLSMILGLYGCPFLLIAYKLVAPERPRIEGRTRLYTGRVKLERVWWDMVKLRGRRGLLVQLALEARQLTGARLELAVRFRGPDGRYLPGPLRAYRGDLGEALVRHRTRPLRGDPARFPRLWMFLPTRALGFPPTARRVVLKAELLVGAGGSVLVEHDLAVEFVPFTEDLPRALPGGAVASLPPGEGDSLPPGAVTFLPGEGVEASACGVCGDLLDEVVVRCQLCEAPHHRECWDYLGGCSTYACEGRPDEASG